MYLYVEAPTESYIDFLNLNYWPHESFKKGKQWFLKTAAKGRPAPKTEMIIGLSSWFEEE